MVPTKYACDDQMSLFDYDPSETYPVREPCGRRCPVAWCSLKCFLRRGYVEDRSADSRHRWARDDKGNILISNNKDCDWVPKGE